jgi:hypothetical protein
MIIFSQHFEIPDVVMWLPGSERVGELGIFHQFHVIIEMVLKVKKCIPI